jgi:hypothetical protein
MNKDSPNKNTRMKQPEKATSTRGLRVNPQYLKSPQKLNYPVDQSTLPKGIRSLDDYQKVYDRDIAPIINSSVIELKRGRVFIERFKDRYPHIEGLSTTTPKKEKYSIIEVIHLLIDKDMLFQKHVTKEPEEVTMKDEAQALKNIPFPKHVIAQKVLSMFTKRTLILDRLLTALSGFDIITPGLRVAKVLLHQNLETKEFYLKSFFDPNTSKDLVDTDLNFIIKKISAKFSDYQKGLQSIYLALLPKILPHYFHELRLLEDTMNSYSSKTNTHDTDYFLYLYREYSLNVNFKNIMCLDPAQRKQLEGYFHEIYILVRLILINARIENTHLLVSIAKLDFIPKTIIINQSLDEFLKSTSCSKGVFSNILKAFTKHTIHIVNFFYAHCMDHVHLCLYPLITPNLMKVEIADKQEPLLSEVKTLVGESPEGELILEDVDKPQS